MFIQGRSLAFSVLIHLLFFLSLIGYFAVKSPRTPLLPQKRVVSVSVRKSQPHPLREATHASSGEINRAQEKVSPPKEPAGEASAPLDKPKTEEYAEDRIESIDKSDSEPVTEKTEKAETPSPAAQPFSTPETETVPPAEETPLKETLQGGGEYSYSFSEIPAVELPGTPVFIPGEDLSLDHLLIGESKAQEGTDSLYSIELTGNEKREILSIPDLVFESKDPVISTLSDCRISFSVTREGLVRNIRMLQPGTGSEIYDEILETLLSRFLFSPGDEETGTIAINFSRISGESYD